MKTEKDIKYIVFLIDGLFRKDNFLRIICQKASWLAEYSEYHIYMVLTEKTKKPNRYELSSKVEIVNLEINYDHLKNVNPLIRPFVYLWKQYIHKKRLTEFLHKQTPVATVSIMGQELNFLSRIKDGSQKIYELHHNKHLHLGHPKGFFYTATKMFTLWCNIFRFRLVIKRHDLLVTDTEGLMKKWKTQFHHVVTIPNPLNTYQEVLEKNEGMKVIGVGDYSSEKGFDHLIDVWERISHKYPTWRLQLYGDGDQGWLRELIKSKHLGKVVQCYDRSDNLFDVYPKYSILVQANADDLYGQDLMIAMSFGIPCVAYDVPYGPRELIQDEVNGFLIKPNQLVDFASKVGILMKDSELRETMGKQAHQIVRKYDLENVMNKWIGLYRSLTFKNGHYSLFHKQKNATV